MKIVVVGATGMVGSRVVAEAVRRDHDVTAIYRGATPQEIVPGITTVRGDAGNRCRMATLFAGHDAVVGTTRPRPGEETTVTATTTALLDAADAAGLPILFVGGAGPLRIPNSDRMAVDDQRFVPERYRPAAVASMAQLDACRGHPTRWTYLSPPAFLEPGERTGAYRRGGDDAAGRRRGCLPDLGRGPCRGGPGRAGEPLGRRPLHRRYLIGGGHSELTAGCRG